MTDYRNADWDGYEDMSDWEYHMQMQDWADLEDDGWSERDDWDDDVAHDAYVLSSAGWGTDEDYGFFGADYEPPF